MPSSTAFSVTVLTEDGTDINLSLNYPQMTPGGHTENVWKMESGGSGRIPPTPGGMTQNVRRTITSKRR